MRHRETGQRVARLLVLEQLRVELDHCWTRRNPGDRQSSLDGSAARAAVAERCQQVLVCPPLGEQLLPLQFDSRELDPFPSRGLSRAARTSTPLKLREGPPGSRLDGVVDLELGLEELASQSRLLLRGVGARGSEDVDPALDDLLSAGRVLR